MARMTVKQRKAIESSLYDIERFLSWIRQDCIQITRNGTNIFKEAGSPLQFIENTGARLKHLHGEQFS